MSECRKCGTATVPGEAFCSNCGTKNAEVPKVSTEETTLEYEDTGDIAAPASSAAESSAAGAAVAPATGEPELSSASLGGHSTGDVPVAVKPTTKKGNTGGRQP